MVGLHIFIERNGNKDIEEVNKYYSNKKSERQLKLDTYMSLIIENNAETIMSDGTVLRSDIYRPSFDGKFPVLLTRTPYDKNRSDYQKIATFMATNGYICIVQDIRGTHQSDGVYHLARNGRKNTTDAEDGYESVEWAAKVHGSSGQVCIWGHSYSSWSAWVAAPTRPPHLCALFGSGMAAKILNNTPSPSMM